MVLQRLTRARLAVAVLVLTLVAAVLGGVATQPASAASAQRLEGLVDGALHAAGVAADTGDAVPLTVVSERDGHASVTVVQAPARDATDAVAAATRGASVRGVGVNRYRQHAEGDVVAQGDTFRDLQWGLRADETSVAQAWLTSSGAGQVIAVVDSGVYGGHEDLGGRVRSGAEFLLGNGTPTGADGWTDQKGHGTFVAGVAAATRDNELGVTGVAGAAQILPVRVLDASGGGWDADVTAGLLYAADNGATVINLSLGGDVPNGALEAAVDYALARDVSVVVSAGNSGPESVKYPAAFPGSIAVAATTEAKALAAFSSYSTTDPYVDIAAPGENITSTYSPLAAPGGYSYYTGSSGTSFSAPFVSGVVAIVRAARPELSAAQVRAVIEASADDMGPAGPDAQTGAGLVDPAGALTASVPATTTTTSTTTTTTAPPPPTTTVPPPPAVISSGYHAITPARVADTRARSAMGPATTMTVGVTGVVGVPLQASAVALNITVVDPIGAGWLTVWPATPSGACAGSPPQTSVLNHAPFDVRASATIVSVGGAGRVCVFSLSSAHVLVDVSGYLLSGTGDRLTPVAPTRLVDTRPSGVPVGGENVLRVSLPAGAPAGTSAAAINLTVAAPVAAGYLTVFPDRGGKCSAEDRPNASNINFEAGQVRANLAYATVGTGGSFCVFSSVDAHVVVDLTGYFSPGGVARFVGQIPARLLDTRGGAPIGPGRVATASVAGDAVAAQLTLTATEPEAGGYLAAWPCGGAFPATSNVNFGPGESVANGTTLATAAGSVCVTADVTSHVVVDTTGRWIAA
jgi:subtilisin family serine protease